MEPPTHYYSCGVKTCKAFPENSERCWFLKSLMHGPKTKNAYMKLIKNMCASSCMNDPEEILFSIDEAKIQIKGKMVKTKW